MDMHIYTPTYRGTPVKLDGKEHGRRRGGVGVSVSEYISRKKQEKLCHYTR